MKRKTDRARGREAVIDKVRAAFEGKLGREEVRQRMESGDYNLTDVLLFKAYAGDMRAVQALLRLFEEPGTSRSMRDWDGEMAELILKGKVARGGP